MCDRVTCRTPWILASALQSHQFYLLFTPVLCYVVISHAQVYLVFELCEGGELFEPIADANFRFSEVSESE